MPCMLLQAGNLPGTERKEHADDEIVPCMREATYTQGLQWWPLRTARLHACGLGQGCPRRRRRSCPSRSSTRRARATCIGRWAWPALLVSVARRGDQCACAHFENWEAHDVNRAAAQALLRKYMPFAVIIGIILFVLWARRAFY